MAKRLAEGSIPWSGGKPWRDLRRRIRDRHTRSALKLELSQANAELRDGPVVTPGHSTEKRR